MSRHVSVRFKSALAAGVALIAAVVAWQVDAALKRPLDAEEMKIDVADLSSYAAEGNLLAKQRIGASTTRSFSKAQSEMWHDKIEQIARKYQSRKPEAHLTKSFGDVQTLAQRLLGAANAVMDNTKGGTATTAAAELNQVESDARRLKLSQPFRAD